MEALDACVPKLCDVLFGLYLNQTHSVALRQVSLILSFFCLLCLFQVLPPLLFNYVV